MAQDAPWFRQNADWWQTKWLDELGYPYNGILGFALAHFKANGNGRGSCKAITYGFFARIYQIPPDHVETFFEAAKAAGAFIDDGKRWTLTMWAEYQSPDAERVRKSRAEQAAIVTDKPEMSVTTGNCPNTVTRQDKTGQDNTLQGESPLPPLAVVDGEMPTAEAEPVDEAAVPLFPVDPEDPWWDGDDVDPLVREAVEACLSVPKFSKTPPIREQFEKLIAEQRARAPDDEAIRYEFVGFASWHSANKPKYRDGRGALHNWFGNRHKDWAGMRRNKPQTLQDRFQVMMGGM